MRSSRQEPRPRSRPAGSTWTRARPEQVRYDGRFGDFQGTGIAFTAMANQHWGCIHDWVIESRLSEMRSAIRLAA